MSKPSHEPENFDLEAFRARKGEALLHMSHFFLGYLSEIYRAFDGDLVKCIILGEISHHNTARYFSNHSIDSDTLRNIHAQPGKWEEMDGCNAYSLSLATGIPRETIRRKVNELEKLGWITNDKQTGLRITLKCGEHFAPDFSLRVLDRMLGAAGVLQTLLRSVSPKKTAGKKGRRATPTKTTAANPTTSKQTRRASE